MRTMKKCFLFFLTLAALRLCLPVLLAAETAAPPEEAPVRETIIFLPEKEMPLIFGREEEGIFVSYREYRELYEKAKAAYFKKARETAVPDALRGPLLVQANYAGSVEDALLNLSARYHIVYSGPEAAFFNFPLKDVFLQAAELNGETVLIQEIDGLPRVLLPAKGTYDLTLHFLVPVDFDEETGRTSFSVPPALLGDIRLTADSFYDIRFPGLALTSKNPGDDRTEFLGFLGPEDTLSIMITNRRSSGEKRVQLSSREEHRVFLSQDILEQVVDYSLDIRYGEMNGVDLLIDPEAHVHEVSGPGIAGWTREKSGTADILHLTFHLPLSGETHFSLKTYQYPPAGLEPLRFMDSRIEKVFDREGTLKIYYDDSVRMEALETRFLRPVVGRFGTEKEDSGGHSLYAEYQIFNLPYEVSVARFAVPRQVLVEQHNDVDVGETKIRFDSELVLSGLPPGTAQFLFYVPAGYSVDELSVYVNADPVQEHHECHPDDHSLRVYIRHPVTAKDEVVFAVHAQRLIGEQTLKEQAAEGIAIPVITYPEAGKMTGSLKVKIDDMYLLSDILLKGYSPAEEMFGVEPDEGQGKNLLYDFRSLDPQGTILLSLRQAEQTSKTVNFIAVDENLLVTNSYIRYSITSGKKDSFYFAIPQWPGSKINIEGDFIKEKKKIPLEKVPVSVRRAGPADLAGCDIWNVVLQKEAAQEVVLAVDYQKKIEHFDSLFDVPLPIPLDVLSDTGDIVLEASKNTKITTQKSGLNELETYEIPQWPAYKPSNRIIESLRYFTRPFTFGLAVTRMDESPVLASLVEEENLVYAFGPDSQIFFEGRYRVKNTNLQFLPVELPDRFVFWAAALDGEGVKPREGSGRTIYIPLPVDSDHTLEVRLTGQMARPARLGMTETLSFQSPRLDVPVLQSHMTVYYPEQYFLLNVRGNFEQYPAIPYLRTALFPGLAGALRALGRNVATLLVPFYLKRSIQGRLKSATDDIGDQFSPQAALQARVRDSSAYLNEETVQTGATLQYEPYYLETEYDLQQEAGRSGGAVPVLNLMSPTPLPSDAPVPYGLRKGLLSLNIDIPKEGASLAAHKLWGDSRLTLTFISQFWKRVLMLFSALLFIVLGFYVRRRNFMTSEIFFMTTCVVGMLLPAVFFRPYGFIFNGAMAGAGLFVVLLLAGRFGRKAVQRVGGTIIMILAAGVFLLSASFESCAENVPGRLINIPQVSLQEEPVGSRLPVPPPGLCFSPEPGDAMVFPDIVVYVPYRDVIPFIIDGKQKLYIPTRDYFRLKFLAEPPYFSPRRLDFIRPFDVTGLALKGVLEEETMVRFNARLDVFVNNEEWLLVPLPFENVFMQELRLDGQSVPIMTGTDVSEYLPVPGQKGQAHPVAVPTGVYKVPIHGLGRHTLDLTFLVEVKSLLGKRTLSFGFPATLLSDFSLDLNSRDVFIEFEEPQAAYYIEEEAPSPVLKASFPKKDHVQLSWFPKKYLKKEEKPLIYMDCLLSLYLGYEHVELLQDMTVRVEKSSIASLIFTKSPGAVITDVFSDKIRSWQEREDGTLEVIFKHEITDAVSLQIKSRREVMPDAVVQAEFFKPQETKRLHGRMNIFTLPGYKVAVQNQSHLKAEGVEGAEALGDALGFELQKSYSFLDGDFQADFVRAPEEERFTADIQARHNLTETMQTSFYNVNLAVKKNVLSGVKLRLPPGQKITAVDAENIADYILQDDILILPLQTAVRDRFSFSLEMEQEVADFTHVTVEGLEVLGAEKVTGTAAVLFPRGYDVREAGTAGLKSANIHEALPSSGNFDPRNSGAGYAYSIADLRTSASFDVLRKESVLDVINVYHTSVQDTKVHVELLCLFTIKNAPVDHFDIVAPAALKDAIEIQGDGIKTILKKDIDERQRVLLSVNTVSKIDHAYMLQVTFNTYFGPDKTFTMPRISFPQVDNKTEFVSVQADTAYHVDPVAAKFLQQTEPSMIPALPAGVDINNILWSYQAVGSAAWDYSLKLKRLEREKLVRARIQREDIKTLLIPNGYALHEVQLKVDNRTLQFLPVIFPPRASLWSLKVAGEPVRASLDVERGSGAVSRYQIPLIKSGAGDRSFDIQIVYLTPVKSMGLFGRMNLGMIDTGDVPVEKTTWSFFVPENYALSFFKTNMEAIDVSVIEVEKTLDLAKEYKYWTGVAKTSQGELREKAIFNRSKVMSDFGDQYSIGQTMQTRLYSKQGDKKYNQALISKAQTENVQILNEAQQIMDANRAEVPVLEAQRPAAGQKAGYDSTRRNVKGWQFKTDNFDGQEQVGRQISQYLQQEDSKQMAVKNKSEKAVRRKGDWKKQVFIKEGEPEQAFKNVVSDEERAQWDTQAEGWGAVSGRETAASSSALDRGRTDSVRRIRAAGGFQASQYTATAPQSQGIVLDGQSDYWGAGEELPQKDTALLPAKAAPAEKKQSALLKGQRSIDIPFPEQGQRFSFKKLGGNPTMAFVYRKSGAGSRILCLLLGALALAGIYRVRRTRFPVEKFDALFKKIWHLRLQDIFVLIVDSRWCKIFTLVAVIPAFLSGTPCCVILVGLASIFLVRGISRWRHKKLGRPEVYNLKVFLKYSPSYVILLASFLSLGHLSFLIFVGLATALNFFLAAGYGFMTLLTKREIQSE